MNWSVFWTAISAVSTASTAVIAAWAIFRWRKQDELKAKQAFKTAIADYSYALIKMPEKLNSDYLREKHAVDAQKLIDLLSACNHAWYLSEGLLESNKKVKECWESLFQKHKHYIGGTLSSSELGVHCIGILTEKFIFK
jgi:hypothetical protein